MPLSNNNSARKTGFAVGLVFFVGCVLFLLLKTTADWVSPLNVQLAIKQAKSGHEEPLIYTGRPGICDLLYLRHQGPGQAVLCYRSADGPIVSSSAFRYCEGSPVSLELCMPSLQRASNRGDRQTGQLKARIGGVDALNEQVDYYTCSSDDIFIGAYPRVGAPNHTQFSGVITINGEPRLGASTLRLSDRKDWIRTLRQTGLGAWITLGILSLLVGILASLIDEHPLVRPNLKTFFRRESTQWFLLCALLCTLPFIYVVTYGSYDLFEYENFSSFYEYQARSILAGHMDVPPSCLQWEAMIRDGKYYGYYGITPALLRAPFLALDIDTLQLTRVFMTLYFITSLICVFKLTKQATRVLAGAMAEPSKWVIVSITLSSGLGSTLLFLASRSYVYHEAILCGICFTLLSCSFSMAWLASPNQGWWIWALICGVLATNARPPTGLYALTLIGVSALYIHLDACKKAGPSSSSILKRLALQTKKHPKPILIGALCVLGLFSHNAVTFLKLHTLESYPLRMHLLFINNPQRMAKIGNQTLYMENVPFMLHGYLTPRSIDLNKHFPYIYATNPGKTTQLSQNHIDGAEDTAGIPYAMPSLCLLATIGGACCLRFAARLRPRLIVTWLAFIPTCTIMLCTVGISHRYTGDFVPFLVLAAVLGICALDLSVRTLRPVWIAGILMLSLISACITAALTLEYQRAKVWGVEAKVIEDYSALKQSIDHFFGAGE